MKKKHVLLKFLRFSFSCHKPYYFTLLYHTLVSACITLFGAYTLSIIIRFLETGNAKDAIWTSLFLVGIEVFLHLLLQHSNHWNTIHEVKMKEAIDHAIAEKIMNIPFSYLENPYYLQLKQNVSMGINNFGALNLLSMCFDKLFSSLLSLLGLIVILISFDGWIVLILGIGILLNVLCVICSVKMMSTFQKELFPINYKYNYYMNTLISTENYKDFRFFRSKNLLLSRFKKLGKEVNHSLKKFNIKNSMVETISSTIRYCQMAIIYIYIGIKTLTKKYAISTFSLTISAAINFSDMITQLIEACGNLSRGITLLKPLIEILDIPQTSNGNRELKHLNRIEFKNVSFKYPNTEEYVLKNVSFVIESGEKISIVGLNGAGKTTIVKLITRLYDVTEGQILINDIPILEYEQNSYIQTISTVFQDYKTFSFSILENIDPNRDLDKVKQICKDLQIHEKIEELPMQYDSIMSKSYDDAGVELSGGQKQKIAIARAIAKDADLLILDEPTSALDPIAEAEIYENFHSLTQNKTAIYISHRMSSSVFCDKILVLNNGEIIDFDSHQNLMKKTDGLYYKLFSSQAINYSLNLK